MQLDGKLWMSLIINKFFDHINSEPINITDSYFPNNQKEFTNKVIFAEFIQLKKFILFQ